MQAKKRGSWVEADENLAAWEGGGENGRKTCSTSKKFSFVGIGGRRLVWAAIIASCCDNPAISAPRPRTCNPTALAGQNNQEIRLRNKNVRIAENFFSPNICMLASVRSFIIPCLWLFFSNLAPACCKYLNLVMRFAVASSRDRKTIFLLQADYFALMIHLFQGRRHKIELQNENYWSTRTCRN